MTLADLEEAYSKAKSAYHADKSDKKLKKKFKKAKKALAAAKEQETSNKRPAEEEISEKPKKKAKTGPSLEDLQKAAKTAKKAWKADKANKDLKKVWKNAKKAVEEFEEVKVVEEIKIVEEVVDIDALKAAMKAAKKIYKKDKSNKEAKAAFKAAKAVLAEAEAKVEAKNGETAPMDTKDASTTDVLAGLKKSTPAAPPSNVLGGLKKGGGRQSLGGRPNDNENPPGPRCFLGNLSYDIDDDKIKEFFKDFLPLTDIFWMTDRETGDFRGCGIIEFSSIEVATKAIAATNGTDLMGRNLKINFARARPAGRGGSRGPRPLSEKHPDCTTVFVGNLPDDVDEAKLTEFLGPECGAISQIRWLTDRETGEFKCAGFVEFEDPSAGLDNAVKKRGQQFGGKTIRIDYAKPREKKW